VSSGWLIGLTLAVNAVSALLYVLAVREQKRITAARKRLRLERLEGGGFGERRAGEPRW
jgi:hypothetical protein